MTTAVPVVTVITLQVKRAANLGGETFIVGQVGRVFAQLRQVVRCHFCLDLVPLLRAFAQRVGLLANHLYHVLAWRGARGVLDGGGQYEQRWLVGTCNTMMEV